MPAPPVYLDQCIDSALAAALAARGFPARTTYAEHIEGADDPAQLVHAAARGWALVSHNKRDPQYWHRIFRQQGHRYSGIILLPQSPFRRLELRAAITLDWIA